MSDVGSCGSQEGNLRLPFRMRWKVQLVKVDSRGEEEKNATIGNRATNDPSESEFAIFTEVLPTGGRIGLDLASGIGQTHYNNDFGRGQEEYVTGRRSKKAPSVKSVGLFHDLPVELQDSLVVTSKRHAPESRQNFNESLRRQRE